MRVFAVCLALALVSCHPFSVQFEDIPLQSCSDLPCLEVTLDGSRPFRLLLDLASESSYITASAAEEAKLVGISKGVLQKRALTHLPQLTTATVQRLQLGALVLHNSFSVVDPGNPLSLASKPSGEIPPCDGTLSYTAFVDRLVVLDMPHHRLRVSKSPYKKTRCEDCSRLLLRMSNFKGRLLATDGFALNMQPTTTILDTLYAGSVVAVEPIPGVVAFKDGTPTPETYSGDKVFFVKTVSVTFGKRILSRSAPLFRHDIAFGSDELQYDAIVGLDLISKYTFVLDLTNMTMRIADSPR